MQEAVFWAASSMPVVTANWPEKSFHSASGCFENRKHWTEELTMGLFDFARDIGKKLFSREEEAADKIKAHIEADNPGVQDLEVKFEQGRVEISGNADNQAAIEKAVLMAGNVRGVEEVRLAGETEPLEIVGKVEFYSIQSGDTLSAIAKRYYGNAMDYPRIFEANREVIKDPDLIYPDQTLRIPKIS